ncbi:MAG: TonB-dependent receptor [Bacteroidota bacterium]
MRTVVFALFLCWGAHLFSQNEITGMVLDENNAPIAFVNVLLLNAKTAELSAGAISDEEGRFDLQSKGSGIFLLQVTAMGFLDYSSETFELTGRTAFAMEEPIRLKEETQQLDEVELVGRKNLFERQTDRTVVNVQSNTINAGGSALSVIETSPGITVNRITGVMGMLGKDGTMVYINGKRVRMSGSALVQMLDGLPSSNIDKLELIHNPPASFDADGIGGVINIILKQQESGSGWNGNVVGNSGYGNDIKYGAVSDVNQTTENFNFFISLSNNNNYNQQPTFVDKSYELNGSNFTEDLDGARDAFIGLTQFRLGGSYKLNPKTEIGVEYKFRRNVWDLDAHSETLVTENGTTSYFEDLTSSEINNWNHHLGSFFVRRELGSKSSFAIEYDYLNYSNTNDASYDERRSENENTFVSNFTSAAETAVEFHVARLDLETVVWDNITLAIGAKGTISRFTNEAQVFDTTTGIPIRDDAFSATRILDEDIWAGYTSLNVKLSEKTNADFGLRYEYTDSNLSTVGEDNAIVLDRGQFFPTLTLSHTFNDHWNTSLSYGERITRPDFSALAPGFYFFNTTTIYAGNPSIRPVTSRSLALNVGHKKKQLTLNFTDEANPNAWRALTFSEDFSTTIINPQPMEDRKLFSTILSFPFRFLQRLTSNHTIGAFWQHEVPIYNNSIRTRNNWYLNLNSTLQYQFSNKLSSDFSVNWISRRILGLSDTRAAIGLNFGFAYKPSEQWQLSFSFRDIIDRNSFMEFDATLPENNANLDWFYQDEGHIGTISLRYNFGTGSKIKERGYGSQEEQNRLN